MVIRGVRTFHSSITERFERWLFSVTFYRKEDESRQRGAFLQAFMAPNSCYPKAAWRGFKDESPEEFGLCFPPSDFIVQLYPAPETRELEKV